MVKVILRAAALGGVAFFLMSPAKATPSDEVQAERPTLQEGTVDVSARKRTPRVGRTARYGRSARYARTVRPARHGRRAALRRPMQQAAAKFEARPFDVTSDLVDEARRYLGSNPTGRRALWCARFMNFVLNKTGRTGSGSDMARSFAGYGQRVDGPQVGAIAVMSRGRRGGHVGVVSGIDDKGNPIVISGNHSRRVAEAVYPRGRVYAYVTPQ